MMKSKGMGLSPLVGSRSLRNEYLLPSHKDSIPDTLRLIEEQITKQGVRVSPVSMERMELKRFQDLFSRGELFPPEVFIAALELGKTEKLNGVHLPYDAEVLVLRDHLLVAYKGLVSSWIRKIMAKETEAIPERLLQGFAQAWMTYEGVWLQNREYHATEALQPLANAILALEPLLLSKEKERLLPWPRVRHQRTVTLRCLEGFMRALGDLAAPVLSSLHRESDHDARLLMLMDHVVLSSRKKEDEQQGDVWFLAGISDTPDVAFPDTSASNAGGSGGGGGITLSAYAFLSIGSLGDLAAGNQRTKEKGAGSLTVHQANALRKARAHAAEVLGALEAVKDFLLSLKSTLEEIDPALDDNPILVGVLQRFERSFKRGKQTFLEPDNLV